jgi:acyl-coenzyme A thioesterase PaaI-like protein
MAADHDDRPAPTAPRRTDGVAPAGWPTDGATPARRAADAVRSLLRVMVHSAAPTALIDDVAEHATRLAAALAPHARSSRYEDTPGATVRPGDNTAIMETHTVVGPANPMAPPLVLERFADRVVGRVRYTLQYEGPPGMLHGGYLGTAFDYVLAAASSLSGQLCMTASMTVNYRAATPLNTNLEFEARVDRVEGRKVFTVATCTTPDGTVTADASGLFVAVDASRYQFQGGDDRPG